MVLKWILSIISLAVFAFGFYFISLLEYKREEKLFKSKVSYVLDEIEKRKNK